ncbi:MAG: hypothetical protein EHM18_14340, partial [Acidobacteria bacterium]
MPLILLTFLLIYTFGAVAFAALLVLSFGQWRKPGRACAGEGANAGILFVSALWFWFNLVVTFKELYQTPEEMWHWYVIIMAVACVFPPLMMRVFYREEEPFLPPSGAWLYLIWAVQFLSFLLIGFALALWLFWAPLRPLGLMRTFSLGLFGLFTIAGLFAIFLKNKSKRPRQTREVQEHRWTLILLGLTTALFLLIVTSIFTELPYGKVIGLAARALPLGFISVGTYFRNRFDFFDAFVKQGAYFLLSLIVLTALFTGVAPMVDQLELGWARPWVYAVFMLPIVFASPWVYRRLGEWLDRVWLGRRFTTVEAVKYFLSEVKEAGTEEDLAKRAQECLGTIMQAPTRLSLSLDRPETDFEPELEITIPSQGQPIGHILMGKRKSDEPFFSQDIAL